MKKTLWTIAAALALVGCSESELLDTPQALEQNAIAFDTYVGDNAQTRAAVIDRGVLGEKGFGVNAYYTGISTFSEATAEGDDGKFEYFMENTKVTLNPDKGTTGVWEYSPVKYWPNNVDDKVSFFAYGPYAKDKDANNIVLDGTDINFTVAQEVKQQVDLVYSNQESEYSTIDKSKQAVNERIHFKFDHALARIAFTVEAAVDEAVAGDNLLDGNTRINVKKVVLMGENDTYPTTTNPFYATGKLSLVDGTWSEEATDDTRTGFTFDGGVNDDGSDSEFYHTVKDVCAETGDEMNVVQLTRFNASERQRLLNDDSYLMIIPQNTTFKIYIEYDVISEGYDNDNTGTYDESAIVNKITSAKALEVDFEAGKAYNFNLVLGMTSVKFEVDEVANWDNATGYEDEEWLPENIPFVVDENGNFLIQSAEELATFSNLITTGSTYIDENGDEKKYANASYLQTADIDLSPVLSDGYWSPIGHGANDSPNNPTNFRGTYDGGGHTVSNVKIHDKYGGAYMSGLFYKVISATIKNLHVEGQFTSMWGHAVGGVVGWAAGNSTIENCHFSGSIELGTRHDGVQSTNYVGGVVGYISGGLVKACSNSATLKSENAKANSDKIGGVVGDASSASVIGCYNTGNISVSTNSNNVGGIVGNTSGTVTSCYNTGTITIAESATSNTVGSILGSSSGTPSYCYYTSSQSAVQDKENNTFTSVKNVTSDELLSTVVPWLNYGLNGEGTTAVGYEYYVESNSLKIRVGSNAGEAPTEEPTEDENTEEGGEAEGGEDAGADEGSGAETGE